MRLPIDWRPRAVPLAPRAVAAAGPAARALARRLLALSDEALAGLAGVAGDDLLVVSGDADALPWADGVIYLGCDPAAPALLLPTALAPTAPAALLERALLARHRDPATPLAVLPRPPRIVPTGAARPLRRDRLRAWLGEDAGPPPAGRPA